jgi:uncharacterized protein (TIGR00730 family)
MSQVIKSVCVYCGASVGASETFLEIATDVGRALGENGIRLIYGGGGIGLMGAVAEATLAAGGEVIGIIPEHLQQAELGHRGLTELKMFDLSQAFVVLPGGMGTLDETFEIITWRQLGMHDKPIILVNHDNYWDPFLGLVDHVIDNGFARPATRQLFSVVGSVGRLFDLLAKQPQTREPSYPERI